MIAAARSKRVKAWAQQSRTGSALARRYVAGADACSAITLAHKLDEGSIASSFFYLGEYLDDRELIERNVREKIAVARAAGAAGLDVHVSMDPTQIGHSVDPVLARANAFRLAQAVVESAAGRPGSHALMFDMEDESVTEATIILHDELRDAGLPVALTLQAYLRRTEADLARQIACGSRVRLVRGAFATGEALAFQSSPEIRTNFRRLIAMMLSPEARERGFRPSFATHDHALQNYVTHIARLQKWRPGEYEFEMLLGVRPALAGDLANRGEKIRLYVPFGEDWWPHAARRVGERPQNCVLLLRSLIDRG